MEVHSTVDQPRPESQSPLQSLVGGFIALLTLGLPVYIMAHYSSTAAPLGTPATSPALVQRPQ
ncbi:MAG: hypothetical protein MH252_20335 [Thermosynechococcaceae cyanobacterium MS004]|nr:hypothetical protein [Thermosynechococcaceae cyanobacterium MS004]